jgi:hypothetical protein
MPSNPFRRVKENPFRARDEQPPANYVARELAARGTVNALLAAPSASGDLLAGASAAVRGLPHILPGGEPPNFAAKYAEEQQRFPASALRAIPRPTVDGITAAVKSVPSLIPGGETPGEAYDRNQFEFAEDESAMREAHPAAAKVGDIAGDVGALFVGRRGTGLNKLMQRGETRLSGKAATAAAETLAGDIGKIFKGPAMQKIARGAGRSVEAGAEAAVLDVLKDPNADPIETAAIVAGGQIVGSGVLAGAQGLVSGGPVRGGLKLTVAAVATMGYLQMMKSATPGGEDRILQSIESGFDKVTLLLGAGVASAALGATRYGRGNTNFSEQTRTWLDGLSTAHRGTTLSLLTDWTEGNDDERAAIESALTAMSNDPTYRGKTPAERAVVNRIRSGAGLARYQTGGEF